MYVKLHVNNAPANLIYEFASEEAYESFREVYAKRFKGVEMEYTYNELFNTWKVTAYNVDNATYDTLYSLLDHLDCLYF